MVMKLNKIDLVIWAKNGERMLPYVLKRIDEVIPKERINQRIFVDDNSIDKTVEIAKGFGWEIYENEKGGIFNAANQALEIVSTSMFATFEQDVLLCKDWLDRVSLHMHDPKVIVAQGLRLSTVKCMRTLQKYAYDRNILTVSFDNAIYKTEKIRELGGFPKKCPMCTDTLLFLKINRETPYKWVIDKRIVSLHLKKDLMYELRHARLSMARCQCKPDTTRGWTAIDLFRYFAGSPFRAFDIVIKKHDPQLIWVYPCLRLVRLIGFLERKWLR